MSEASIADEPSRRANLWLIIGGVIAAIVGLLVIGRLAAPYFELFGGWVAELGFWAPIVFIAGYVAATILFVPGSILTFAAGAIFGIAEGSIYVFVGATLGACAAFGLGRTVARGAIEGQVAGNAKFAAIDRAVGAEGFKMVALLRLSPVFPFNLLNYALGLTRVPFSDYALASIGMIPGTILYVYLGAAAKGVAAAAASSGDVDVARSALLIVGLVATGIVTWLVTRAARRALGELTADADGGVTG